MLKITNESGDVMVNAITNWKENLLKFFYKKGPFSVARGRGFQISDA